MAEKITLFSADIDTKDIVKQLGAYKRELEDIKKAQKTLDTSTKEGSEQFVRNQAEIKNIRAESNKYEKALIQLNDASGSFLNVQKGLDTALNKEITSIQGARDSNKELLAIRNNLNLNSKEGKKAQEDINVQLDKNNAFIKENVSQYEKQKIGIGDYAGGIKEALGSSNLFGQSQNQVLQVVKGFSPVFNSINEELKGIVSGFKNGAVASQQLAGGQKAAAQATNLGSTALKLFRVALISTGIGLIVVALGSLIAYLSTTQAGIDQVTKITKPLTVIFGRLFGIVQELGAGLFEAFSNPKQALSDLVDFIKNNVINRFKSLAVIIEGFQNFDVKQIANGFAQAGTGVEDVIGKLQKARQGAGEFLSDSIDLGNKLRDIGIEVEERESKIALQRAKANNAIKEQELIAKDSSRTAAERNAAAQEASRLQDEQIQKEEAIIQLKIQELKIEQSLNDTSREENKELNELEASLIAKGQERKTNELKFLTAQTAFRKEAAKAAEEAANKRIELTERASSAEIEASKIRLQLLKEENENNPAINKIQAEQVLRDERIKILDSEIEAYKNSQEFKNAIDEERQVKFLEFSQERIDINQQLSDTQNEIAVANGLKELEAVKSKNQEILKEGQFLTQELKAQEEERISEIFDAELSQLQLTYDNKLLSEEEFQNQKNELINGLKDEQNQIDAEFEASQQEQKIANFELELEIRRLNGESLFAIKLEELEREKQAELANAEATGADKALIEAKYSKQIEKVNDAEQKSKVDNAVSTASAISGLLSELAGENKELAIAAALIDGGLAVQKTLASVPFPASIIPAAAVTVRTVKNVNTIRRAEDGISFQGTLKGASHAQGGIDLGNGVEAEGGENMYTDGKNTHIVNKRASGLINRLGVLGALSYINQKVGGGVALSVPTRYAAKGGLISGGGQNNFKLDYEKLGQSVASANSQLSFNVGVNEINDVNNNILEVNEFATV